MDFQFFDDNRKIPHGVAVIENFYTENELKLIWKELDYLTSENLLLPPEKTGTSLDRETGKPRKENSGLFLDEYYKNRNFSSILTLNRKVFSVLNDEIYFQRPIFRYMATVNSDSTLLNYYEDNNYYKPHIDNCVYTVLTYFFKEPKQFSGGNFRIVDYDLEFEIKNNMVIYMPSCYLHEALPVKMEQNQKGYGRYCLSQFMFITNGY